jgi:hypothetical protein
MVLQAWPFFWWTLQASLLQNGHLTFTSAFHFFSGGRMLNESVKDHSRGLREDAALGAVSAVPGAFSFQHGYSIQQALLFVKGNFFGPERLVG